MSMIENFCLHGEVCLGKRLDSGYGLACSKTAKFKSWAVQWYPMLRENGDCLGTLR
jgi:hypothetical protein